MKADLSRVAAIIPARTLEGSKTRLGEVLDPEERAELVLAMMDRTVAAAEGATRVDEVWVVTPDSYLFGRAKSAAMTQDGGDLNDALIQARVSFRHHEPSALLVLPIDLPEVTSEAIDDFIRTVEEAAAQAPDRPVVGLVSDQHRLGTNALLISPFDAIEFCFGEGSRLAHQREAAIAGATLVEMSGPLSFDLDTPEDMLRADMFGLGREARR